MACIKCSQAILLSKVFVFEFFKKPYIGGHSPMCADDTLKFWRRMVWTRQRKNGTRYVKLVPLHPYQRLRFARLLISVKVAKTLNHTFFFLQNTQPPSDIPTLCSMRKEELWLSLSGAPPSLICPSLPSFLVFLSLVFLSFRGMRWAIGDFRCRRV